MKRILHWSPRSPYVRKVTIALHEKCLADSVETLRTLADPLTPPVDFMKVNPLAKIPTLELGDGTVLFDSRVILEWIDMNSTSGPTLFPSEPAARLAALHDDALGTGMIDIAMTLLIELRLRPAEQRSVAIISANQSKFEAALDHLETGISRISNRPFDAGHLAIGTALSYYDFRFDDQNWRRGRALLARWHSAFAERPSVVATAFADDPRPSI